MRVSARSMCIGIAVSAVLGLVGCGKSNQEVIDEYRDRFEQKRTQLAEIAKKLPPKGSVAANSCTTPPDPKPVFRKKSFIAPEQQAQNNTDVVMAAQLENPDVNLRLDNAWDLLLSDSLVVTLQWTGPQSPLSATGNTATDEFRQNFERALGLRYLVVGRVAEDVAPQILDEKTFVPGHIRLEGFVVDLKSNQVICSLVATAESDTSIGYQYKKREDGSNAENPLERAAAAAHSNLWENVRMRLIDALAATTGGTFEIDGAVAAESSH